MPQPATRQESSAAQTELERIADAAFAAHPRTFEAARAHVRGAVIDRADLLWPLFAHWQTAAIDTLLGRAAARAVASRSTAHTARSAANAPRSGANLHEQSMELPPRPASAATAAAPSSAAREAARIAVVTVISKLDTVIVNGRRIGDCTPEEALAARRAKLRDARFLYLIAANLPPGRPIRDFITPAEAEDLWQRAQAEIGNE